MRVFILLGALTLSSSAANAVFWRGISAPTNIDYHGWFIIKEPPPSPVSVDPGERGLLRSAMPILIGGMNELRAWIKARAVAVAPRGHLPLGRA